MVESENEATTVGDAASADRSRNARRCCSNINHDAINASHTSAESVSDASGRAQQAPGAQPPLLTDRTQCLRLETITDSESRVRTLSGTMLLLGRRGAVNVAPHAEGDPGAQVGDPCWSPGRDRAGCD